MIQVWMLLLSLFICEAYSAEFTHIKLNSQFEQYLVQPKLKRLQTPSEKSTVGINQISQKIRISLLGANDGAGDFTTPFPGEGEESPLYEEIRSHLEAAHREIGLREVTQLDFLNRQFNLGTENFSGFSWQKPYGVIHVHADRQVTPNLFGSNWLIQDTFSFDIDATTFLQKTNEAGITDMTDLEIGAFAGITFKRIYTYYHYANSYSEGLRADFSKLFLPFLKMNVSGIGRMGHEEIIKREDNWTVSAGGLITTPPLYNFSISGGVLAQSAYQQMVSVQNTIQERNAEKAIRLSLKSKKTTSAAINLSLQLDFFKLLKLTILNYDLSYEYAQSKEFALTMNDVDWNHVTNDSVQGLEIRKILKGVGQVKSLEPYIVSLNESESQSLSQRGSLLVWGRLSKSKTEQIRVIKGNVVKIFFKNYAQNLRVVQNIFSRIFSAAIYKLFKLPFGTKNAALLNRQVNLEFEATHPQASDPKVMRIENAEQFSFVLNQSYEASRTDRWIDQRFKNDAIWFVDVFTTLPKDYKAILRQEQLKGPLLIETNLRVEKTGFDYFLNSPIDEIFGHIAEVCDSQKIEEWMDPTKRSSLVNSELADEDICVKNMGKKYLSFKEDYLQNFKKPSLVKFKDFLTKYYKRAESLSALVALFGEENTFIHGQLKATTSQDSPFITAFSSGQFRGLGVIDNYKRADGSRQPASIINE